MKKNKKTKIIIFRVEADIYEKLSAMKNKLNVNFSQLMRSLIKDEIL